MNRKLSVEDFNKKDLKNISKEWVFILFELLPAAVLHYDGFLLLDDFIKKLNSVQSNDYEDKIFSNTNDFQKLIMLKILILLPKVVSFLDSSYKESTPLNKTDNFKKRLFNEEIADLKWFLDIYFYPYKIFDRLLIKNSLNRDDIGILKSLNKFDFSEELSNLLFSKTLDLKSMEFILENILELDDITKSNTLLIELIDNENDDNRLHKKIKERIIEEIVVSEIRNREFFVKVGNNNLKNKNIKFMIECKIYQIDNNKEALFSLLNGADVYNTVMILKLLFNTTLELKELKKIFKYVFDGRKDSYNEYVVSKEVSSLFSIYFIKEATYLEKFKPVFMKYLKSNSDLKDEIFSNFATILNISLKTNDIEKLISNVLDSIENIDIKKITIEKFKNHFLYCDIVSDGTLLSKSELGIS